MQDVLEQLAAGEISVAEAARRIGHAESIPGADATVDHDRARRCGAAEVVFAERKTPDQVITIARTLLDHHGHCLITRCGPEHTEAIKRTFPEAHTESSVAAPRTSILLGTPPEPDPRLSPIPIVTAGTSDFAVADEAQLTCTAMGQPTIRITDVGVAGLHRLTPHVGVLRDANVVICIAGMEGALPSVVAGLIPSTVIAVPTSVGYGAAFNGVAALLGMLTSCASGVVVVNIDAGFSAAFAASRLNRLPLAADNAQHA